MNTKTLVFIWVVCSFFTFGLVGVEEDEKTATIAVVSAIGWPMIMGALVRKNTSLEIRTQ